MRVIHNLYKNIPTVSAAGALLLILAVGILAGIRASVAHAISHTCTMKTATIMQDKMPYYIGQEWHYVCDDPGARIIDPNQNSYLSFQVYTPLDNSWDLYDIKFVSRDKSYGGDFSFLWYDECFPPALNGANYQWRGRASLTVDFSDGTWLIIPYVTNPRLVPCDPGHVGGP